MQLSDAVATPVAASHGAAQAAAQPAAHAVAAPVVPSAQQVWYDGELIDPHSPRASVYTHALHYGSGVFEGIRAYATDRGTAVFRLREHLERMRQGAELLGMEFDIATATDAVCATLRANRLGDAYIRPLAWFGEGGFGLDVAGHTPHLMVATSGTNLHLGGNRARVAVSKWRRNPADSLPPLKLCGAYVNSILAKREVKARGYDEAMFVDAAGDVVECTGANLFMVRDGRVTAIAHRDALPGITRATLIALTGAESRSATLEELLEADEIFACGTAAEVTPIGEVFADDTRRRVYTKTAAVGEIAALYADAVRGRSAQADAWLTVV